MLYSMGYFLQLAVLIDKNTLATIHFKVKDFLKT